MTDKTINHIINIINNCEFPDYIFLMPISINVKIGKVWINNDKGDIAKSRGYDMFFIQNEQNITVAAVLDMGSQDMHVYVKPKHRRKGLMLNALKKTILPYLFSNGRTEQNITFQSINAKHHAELVGFHVLSNSSAVITPEKIEYNYIPKIVNITPSEQHIERIVKRINMAADLLRMASDDFRTAFGDNDIRNNLDYSADDTNDLVWDIKELWKDYKRTNQLA